MHFVITKWSFHEILYYTVTCSTKVLTMNLTHNNHLEYSPPTNALAKVILLFMSARHSVHSLVVRLEKENDWTEISETSAHAIGFFHKLSTIWECSIAKVEPYFQNHTDGKFTIEKLNLEKIWGESPVK